MCREVGVGAASQLLLCLLLCCSLPPGITVNASPNASMSQDCQLIDSDKLNITLPSSVSHTLPYATINSILGLSFYYEAEVSNEKMKNNRRRWKGPKAVKICQGQDVDFSVENIELTAINDLEKDDALLMDLIIMKHENENETEIVCQADLPSTEIMTQDDCQACLDDLASFLGINSININHMNLKLGVNNVFVNHQTYSTILPKHVVCKDRSTRIATVPEDLGFETALIIQKLKNLDLSLGSKYMEKLDKICKDCGFEDLKDMMEKEPPPDKIKRCFKLQMQNAKRTKRDMTLIKTGGSSGEDDPNLMKDLNQNFEKLMKNDKNLFKEMLALGLDKRLETKVIANHEENLKHINNMVTGIETHRNIGKNYEEYLQHLLKHCSTTYKHLLSLEARIDIFQKYLSKALEGNDLICMEMNCFRPEDIYLRSPSSGLTMFIRSNRLTAIKGLSPSCLMTNDHLISKFHMKHMDAINNTHFKDDDNNVVSKECLLSYDQCDKDIELRKIVKEDLLENNLLISPSKDAGYRIQCIKATVLRTKDKYQTCSMIPNAVQLPITLASGGQIGHDDIKITSHDSPVNSLRELSEHIFRSSMMKIKEMQELGKIKWKKMFQTDQVNTSHVEGGLTVGSILVGIMAILTIIHCCLRIYKKETPCGTQCNKSDEKDKEGNKKSRSWRFRKRKSSTSDDVEMVSCNSNSPTAPDMIEAIAPAPASVPNLGQATYPNLDSLPRQEAIQTVQTGQLGTIPRPTKYIVDLGSLIRNSPQ